MIDLSGETVERIQLPQVVLDKRFYVTVCRKCGAGCGFPGWEYPCHNGTPEHGRTHLMDIKVAPDPSVYSDREVQP